MQENGSLELPTPRNIASAFAILSNELQEYRRRVLPRLTDAATYQPSSWEYAAAAMQDNADAYAHKLLGIHRIRVEALDASDIHVEPDEAPTCAKVRSFVLEARATLHPSEQVQVLKEAYYRAGVLPDGWSWDGKRMIWWLTTTMWWHTKDQLDDCARHIAPKLGVEARSAEELRQLVTDSIPKAMMKAVRRLDLGTFSGVMEPLLWIAPELPDALLLIPTGRYGAAASVRPDPQTAMATGIVARLLGIAMEVRANNHFAIVWRTAVRPETRGGSRLYMAAQVLDILCQKWLILHELKELGSGSR